MKPDDCDYHIKAWDDRIECRDVLDKLKRLLCGKGKRNFFLLIPRRIPEEPGC